jgi:putative FmdB family regulatory protein
VPGEPTRSEEEPVPTYAYACTDCDHSFEAVQSFSDDSLTDCPQCHGRLRKVYANVGVVFKGSGFYRNDSRTESGAAKNGTAKDGSKDSTRDSSKDSGKDGAKAAEKGSGEGSAKTAEKAGSSAGSLGDSGSSASKSPSTSGAKASRAGSAA